MNFVLTGTKYTT